MMVSPPRFKMVSLPRFPLDRRGALPFSGTWPCFSLAQICSCPKSRAAPSCAGDVLSETAYLDRRLPT